MATFLERVSSALAEQRLADACKDLTQLALTDADAAILLGVVSEHCSVVSPVERGQIFRLIKGRVNAVGYPLRGDVAAWAQAQQQGQQQQQPPVAPWGLSFFWERVSAHTHPRTRTHTHKHTHTHTRKHTHTHTGAHVRALANGNPHARTTTAHTHTHTLSVAFSPGALPRAALLLLLLEKRPAKDSRGPSLSGSQTHPSRMIEP
jgi:hypothetical protein